MELIREITVNYKSTRRKTKVCEPKTVAAELRAMLPDNSREHFCALYLDGAHHIVSRAVLSSGAANAAGIHPRELFQPAILSGACAIAVGHSHPSGDCTPSPEDKAVTKRLIEAGKLLGIPILDHVIVSDSDYYSFLEGGLL